MRVLILLGVDFFDCQFIFFVGNRLFRWSFSGGYYPGDEEPGGNGSRTVLSVGYFVGTSSSTSLINSQWGFDLSQEEYVWE